jgi:hypothetical protein
MKHACTKHTNEHKTHERKSRPTDMKRNKFQAQQLAAGSTISNTPTDITAEQVLSATSTAVLSRSLSLSARLSLSERESERRESVTMSVV